MSTGPRIRTNNVIERLNREIRRRTRVVGSFPDGNSALMLVCARLRHVAGTQWGNKKYMNMKAPGGDLGGCPPLLADFIYGRVCELKCEKILDHDPRFVSHGEIYFFDTFRKDRYRKAERHLVAALPSVFAI